MNPPTPHKDVVHATRWAVVAYWCLVVYVVGIGFYSVVPQVFGQTDVAVHANESERPCPCGMHTLDSGNPHENAHADHGR